MIVTIFTTRIKYSELFDAGKAVANDPANNKLKEYFRRSTLSDSLSLIADNADQKKVLRNLIINSWLSKNDNTGNPYFDEQNRIELEGLIPQFYEAMDNKNSPVIGQKQSSINEILSSVNPSPFSFTDCISLHLMFNSIRIPDNWDRILNHMLQLPDESLIKAGINIDDHHSIFLLKCADDSLGKGVYGIECLDSAGSSNEWIKTLLECAKLLEGGDDSKQELTIQLILHDKDLPNGFFGQHDKDVYVLKDEELDSLVPNWKKNGIETLRIAFFHHTTNELAHLVKNTYDNQTDIHQRVSSYIEKYFNKKQSVEDKDKALYD